MQDGQIKVREDIQDRESEGWYKLLDLVKTAATDEREVFNPGKELGIEIWKSITSLPREIANLKKVKKLMLYGSSLQRIPQEIGEMESLEVFTPYTSYRLRWFPYEIIDCKNLNDSSVSIRALFGNYKNKKPFPNLNNNPVQYFGGNKCSICKSLEEENRFEQYWISIKVGRDILPLLAIICSDECYLKSLESFGVNHPAPHKGEKSKK